MVLSKRERLILLATVCVVAALLADRYVLTPVARRLEAVENEKQNLLAEVGEAGALFERRRLLQRKHGRTLSEGLQDAAAVESRVLRLVGDWSADTGITLSSVKPERVPGDGDLREIAFTVAGRGDMEAVAGFLWQVETAELPLKIKHLQLGSVDEAREVLSIQVRLSSLYVGPKSATRPATQETQDEEI